MREGEEKIIKRRESRIKCAAQWYRVVPESKKAWLLTLRNGKKKEDREEKRKGGDKVNSILVIRQAKVIAP